MRSGKLSLCVLSLIAALSSVGCVSRDEYLRTKFTLDNANARLAGLETELADERSRNNDLRNQVETLQREKDTLQALADNLRTENARLDAYSKDLLAKMNDVLNKGLPSKIDVVEVKLPPELDRALKEFAAKYPDTVEYDPAKGVVRWKSDLTFALGSDVVREQAKQALQAFSQIVNSPAAAGFEVVIVGHTDNVPIRKSAARFPTNWHLSCFRSIAVMFALHEYGVDYTRMGCMGYGEHRPREANPPTGGNERNRRVEIFLVSAKSPLPGAAEADIVPGDGSRFVRATAPDTAPPAGSTIPDTSAPGGSGE
ncbi:MAG: OmpA family protein [Phycisphaerae bacterium]|nr:OmpA family protein [Phycisphaerae bacterium]